jgi:NADPH:quinone reductase-like Zn-dependent oxidoreductase
MSRSIKFAKAGGPEVLEFVEVQVPAPGPNEVRIKVKAIGINRAEAMWRVDDYIERVKFPAGLGYEAAGTVDAVGKDVSGFAVGDEVNVIPSFSLNDYSTYGEVILVPGRAVVRQPKSLSFTEAASVWMMFVTAYGALIEDAKVAKGDFVLIPAASSSVGLAAMQIANYAGATTIALTRTSAKKQQLLDAGAAHVIATEEVDLVREVMRITNGQGARVAFDPVGGPSFPKLISALSNCPSFLACGSPGSCWERWRPEYCRRLPAKWSRSLPISRAAKAAMLPTGGALPAVIRCGTAMRPH